MRPHLHGPMVCLKIEGPLYTTHTLALIWIGIIIAQKSSLFLAAVYNLIKIRQKII